MQNQLLNYLNKRTHENWLVDYDSYQFNQLTQEFFEQFTLLSQIKTSCKILLAEENPLKFFAAFLASVAANCPVFLCNSQWGQQEWEQVFTIVQPDLIIGKEKSTDGHSLVQKTSISSPLSAYVPICRHKIPNQIMIPTGGSSGTISFVVHTLNTLTASVRGFHQYFCGKKINSFCVLPLYHVSGLMQFLRSFLTGGRFAILPYKALKEDTLKYINSKSVDLHDFFISLVPTQLQFLLESNPDWLLCFDTVLLGGAPAWPSLLETARKYKIRLALTYGMTETASQIVTLKPEDFLKGNNSSGQVLPHAQVYICHEGKVLKTNQPGVVTIKAKSLCLGYYPEIFSEQHDFQTDDLGFFDINGYLHIVGRCSQKIITGGENVFPTEVEAIILATQLVTDVCVIGLPDSKWGQAVTAIYVPKQERVSLEVIKTAIKDKISQFKQPKYWISIETLSRNSQGKIDYQQLRKVAWEKLVELTQIH